MSGQIPFSRHSVACNAFQNSHYYHYIECFLNAAAGFRVLTAMNCGILNRQFGSGYILSLVREGRLELPFLAELDPKSSASANFATLALDFIFFIFLFYLSKKKLMTVKRVLGF
jgi:hypothetical protein